MVNAKKARDSYNQYLKDKEQKIGESKTTLLILGKF